MFRHLRPEGFNPLTECSSDGTEVPGLAAITSNHSLNAFLSARSIGDMCKLLVYATGKVPIDGEAPCRWLPLVVRAKEVTNDDVVGTRVSVIEEFEE